MKWYYTVLIIIVVIIIVVLILGIVIDKVVFKGSFGELIKTLINAKKGNIGINLSEDNLDTISDNELNLSVLSNINKRYNSSSSGDEFYTKLNENEKTFYIIFLYDMDFQCGGLCQYFINNNDDTAKYLSDELIKLGANKTEKEFNQFVAENNIDINDLSRFDPETKEDYTALYNLYPFEEYDDKAIEIYKEENLESMLANFVKDNISDFIDLDKN